jgi:hypothetical protein
MFKRKLLCCSFCGKTETQVAKLVAGPRVYICDECVAAARRIMDSSPPGEERLAARPDAFRLRRLMRALFRPSDSGKALVASCRRYPSRCEAIAP